MKQPASRLAVAAVLAGLSLIAYAIPEAGLLHAALGNPDALLGVGLLGTLAVADGKRLRQLKSERAALVDQMATLNAKADFDDEADGKTFAGLKSKRDSLDAAIERETDLIAESLSAKSDSVVEIPGQILGVKNNADADRAGGFKSFGHFASTVAKAGMGDRGAAQQLQAAAPGTYGGESTGADGGFAIPPQFSSEIWRLSLGEDSLIPQTENTEITGNTMVFPKDETTPWGGAGVQAYWQVEAQQASASKPQLTTEALTLHKLMVLVPMTNELVADGFAAGSYLQQVAPERITWKANEAILFGDGIGKPLGALNGPSLITQAKDGSQPAATITNSNLSNMVSRLLVGQLKNAIWLGNPDVLPALEAMSVGNYPIYLPNNSVEGPSYGMLKGRPLWLSEHAAALGDAGDLNLLSLKGYRTITKAGGIETATSMHLYFDADALAFRFTFRLNGKPILSKPVTPPKSAKTRAHFIALAARA